VNLEKHLRVIWRQKVIIAVGIILGCALAFMAAYKVGPKGLERRGTEQWSSESRVLVTQTGFPWGRVTLPSTAAGAAVDPTATTGKDQKTGTTAPDSRIQFADPSRFSNLALLFAQISESDQVRRLLPGPPAPGTVIARPLDATGSGDSFLPILSVTTMGKTAGAAIDLNKLAVSALRHLLVTQQNKWNVAANDRVLIQTLNEPGAPMLVQSRSMAPALLAFLLAVFGAVALAHIVEGLRRSRNAPAEPALPAQPASGGAGQGFEVVSSAKAATASDSFVPVRRGNEDELQRARWS
jgi:hypothetical protein